jgi:hypothetical protein
MGLVWSVGVIQMNRFDEFVVQFEAST